MTSIAYIEKPLDEEHLKELHSIAQETFTRIRKLALDVVNNMEEFNNQHENIKMANMTALMIRMTQEISKKIMDTLLVEMTLNYVGLMASILDTIGVVMIGGGEFSDVEKNN
ncbi:MAG: hypothetical protein DRJ38_07815 [Thermoprotei archaeon]|nr:MAG: hypothetical protein DRJ38_07815 [Thermoprotei archaeon]